MINNWGLVIKTSEYTGNFEREMCAWCTGQVGLDDSTGEDMIDPSEDYNSIFEGAIEQIADEDGMYRPVNISEDDSTSLIIYFYTEPTSAQIGFIIRKALTFNKARKTIGHMARFYQDSNIKIEEFSIVHFSKTKIIKPI